MCPPSSRHRREPAGDFSGKAPPLQRLERAPAVFPVVFSFGYLADPCFEVVLYLADPCFEVVLLPARGFRCRRGRARQLHGPAEFFEAGRWLVLLLSRP